ncbi:hypothetical protein PB2503_04207 [Parvularcula bermudensis HTCC2503]|uniref:Uncharacterized protein n=1 Tax=Parvularcula bermudensis (strain ATCC BAA-594 / HTCC2503 / KCTC 12087) TaxID=314260 RepID=E0TEN3_PARBH|nr:hypothetical protein [Parvularcula bermudensis]ADM08916.1 hypothetical protein PB2503_04207 [Parvularcula bermudensis HTCC2503]
MRRYGYRSRLRALILVVLGMGLSPLAIVAAHAHRQPEVMIEIEKAMVGGNEATTLTTRMTRFISSAW